jgi:biopolymer transport protein ExbD
MHTPLGILEKVRPAQKDSGTWPVLLALVCAALIAVLCSHFVYAPGMYVGFSNVRAAANSHLTTPVTNVGDLAQTSTTVTLISARGAGVYVIDGRVVDDAGLKVELQRLAADKTLLSRPVLIKADALLTMQSFISVCESVRRAGFPGVLIAADER